MADKKDAVKSAGKELEEAKVKKKLLTNKRLIGLILGISVIIAIALFATNFVRGKVLADDSSSESAIEQDWHRVADTITNMIESANLSIDYTLSNKRNILSLIGNEAYYTIQVSDNRMLYIMQKNYTSNTLTDEEKLKEANDNIKSGQTVIYAKNVLSFSVDNFNMGTKQFSDDTVQITLGIATDNDNYRASFSVKNPSKKQ